MRVHLTAVVDVASKRDSLHPKRHDAFPVVLRKPCAPSVLGLSGALKNVAVCHFERQQSGCI